MHHLEVARNGRQMRATVLRGAGDVAVVEAPDPIIQEPGDVVVRIVASSICGSDLHPYHSLPRDPRSGSGMSSSAS